MFNPVKAAKNAISTSSGGPLNGLADAAKKEAEKIGLTKKAQKAGVPSVTTGNPSSKEITSQTTEAPVMARPADGRGNNTGVAGDVVPGTNIPGSQPTHEVGAAAGKAKDGVRDATDGSPKGGPGGSSAWTGLPTNTAGAAPVYKGSTNPNGTIVDPLSAHAHLDTASASTFNPATASQGVAGAALTDRAMQQGPSPWLNLQLQQQDRLKQDAMNNATAANAGATAQARTGLATHGGLSSGAMERVAKSGANSTLDAQQNISNQDIQQRNLLGIADENTKTGLLGTAAGLEQGLSQFNAGQTNTAADANAGRTTGVSQFNAGAGNNATGFDINNALTDKNNQFGTGLDAWKTMKTADAANSNANAIANAVPGGKKLGV